MKVKNLDLSLFFSSGCVACGGQIGAVIQIFTIQMVESLMLNKISNIEIDPTIVRAGLGRRRWLFNHLSCFSLFAKTNTHSHYTTTNLDNKSFE